MHFFEYFRLTPQAFDLIRFLLIIIAVVLRLVLMPIYLQAYLNLAYDRLEEQKKEAGRITNVDLQKKVCVSFKNRFKSDVVYQKYFNFSLN